MHTQAFNTCTVKSDARLGLHRRHGRISAALVGVIVQWLSNLHWFTGTRKWLVEDYIGTGQAHLVLQLILPHVCLFTVCWVTEDSCG